MGRLKRKNNFRETKVTEEEEVTKSEYTDIPIPNLPNNFLWMRVNSGTKIRNVLGYALKEFPNHQCIVWTGIGKGVGKSISCAQLFKIKHEGLHQITKLRYVVSKRSKEKMKDIKEKARVIPEIHIFLSKIIKDVTEPGYQAPDDPGKFNLQEDTNQIKTGYKGKINSSAGDSNNSSSSSTITSIDAEKFAAMGLRTGQKRPKREQQSLAPPKKNKKKDENTQ